MSGENVVQVNQNDWQSEVIDASVPVLVDFWAEWCGPCRAIAPVLEELGSEMAGSLKIAKVNVDNNADLANQFNVRSIPTMMLFKDGEKVDQLVGAMSKAALKEKLDPHLG